MKTIGVLTSGGDAPGMNAAIRAVVRSATDRKCKVIGIRRGYWGLIESDFEPHHSRTVGGIINRGGTILRTVRCPEFKAKQYRERAYKNIMAAGLDALVVIGGNGSATAANVIHREMGLPVAVVPASIDNDVYGTEDTVGFDTAVNTAVEAVDKIRDTATSHERIFVVEVMGRHNGFIALEVALGCGAEAVLVPEIPYHLQQVCWTLMRGHKRGKFSSIIIMAEGAGASQQIVQQIKKITRLRVRLSVLGYIQRGGSPTAHSRLLAARLGNAAVRNIMAGYKSHLAGIMKGQIVTVPLQRVATKRKRIDRSIYTLTNQMAQ
ncbi:6-phosphofructokinase [candidate division FCPU426 bacterium]|nr:6-phosphofructokinase [candidate division FCPU426 bacterium]